MGVGAHECGWIYSLDRGMTRTSWGKEGSSRQQGVLAANKVIPHINCEAHELARNVGGVGLGSGGGLADFMSRYLFPGTIFCKYLATVLLCQTLMYRGMSFTLLKIFTHTSVLGYSPFKF